MPLGIGENSLPGGVSAVKAKTPRVPRPVLDVLLAVFRASAGKTHSRNYVSVDRLALPLNRERATAAIEMAVLSGCARLGA